MLKQYSRLKMPFVLWMAVTLYFSFQFVLRMSVGILREEIMIRFNVDTATFGTLAGYWYLGYAGMQIPLGFMLDKFNFRYVTVISIITSALGTLTFCLASTWSIVLIGRFLIGAGSGVAFLAVAKVTKTFFPEKMHSMLLGFAFTVGLSGAVVGELPTRLVVDYLGYDATLLVLTAIAVFIAFIILAVNDRKIERFETNQENSGISTKETFQLMFNPVLIYVGLCGGLMVGSLEGFADVWAIPYFMQIYGFNHHDSIAVIAWVFWGMCFGGPFLAFCSEKFKSTILMIMLTGVLTCIIFVIMFLTENMNYTILRMLMFVLGILCSYQVLVFTLTTQLVDKSCAGLAISIINCLNMSFGHVFHKLISNIMQSNWSGDIDEKYLPVYNHEAYVMALGVIPLFALIGTLGFVYLSSKQRRGKLKKIKLI